MVLHSAQQGNQVWGAAVCGWRAFKIGARRDVQRAGKGRGACLATHPGQCLFDAGGGDAFDQEFLADEEGDDDGQQGYDGHREHGPPVGAGLCVDEAA